MRLRGLASFPLLALLVAACAATSPTAPATASVAPANLTIYAAASLESVLAKVATAYQAANPGTTFTVSTDASSALETKIEQGAPADVFLSADTANPQKLVDKGLAVGAVTVFAGNRLTVIVPTANPAGIRSPADLAKPGVKIVATTDGVPIQKYAAKLVANLAQLPGYPADFVARYTANVVSKEDNVGAVAAKVSLGEGDAAIVYVTDAKAWDNITSIAVPDAANVPATYGGVVVKSSPNPVASAAFLAWLAGTDGRSILASFGFLPAP